MKLIGYVDGVEVIFTFSPPNQFIVEIPNKHQGIYIIELHLYGDNYSHTNLTKALVGIDFRNLNFKFLSFKYNNLIGKLSKEYEEKYPEFESSNIIFKECMSEYEEKYLEFEDPNFICKEYIKKYDYKIIM